MLIVLPPIVLGLLTCLFLSRWSASELLNAVAKSHVIFFVCIAVSTEVLSALNMITGPGVLGVWTLLLLACVLAAMFRGRRCANRLPQEGSRGFSPFTMFLVGSIMFTLAGTFATAVLYPPNNGDSMIYHMARVMHWICNRNVDFYPTEIGPQNYVQPLSEFAVLHLQLLSGTDRFANCVQWSCFVVSIGLVAGIACELGLSQRGQLVAGALASTMPMAILQSSSTQTDVVTCSFVLSFALFMLRLKKCFGPENVMLAALSLGLALLAKGTAYLYCAGFGTCLGVSMLYEARRSPSVLSKRLGGLALVALTALLLNSMHLARGYRLYGKFLDSGDDLHLNHDLTPSALLSAIPRHMALHAGTTSPRLNWYVYRGLQMVLGRQLYNPDTTSLYCSFGPVQYSLHEDSAGNPVHMFLAVFSLGYACWWLRKGGWRHAGVYMAGVALAGVLYCSALRWNPWASRYQTPLFALSVPIIALALTHLSERGKGWCMGGSVALAVLLAIPFVLKNQTRPLLSLEWLRTDDRAKLYFMNRQRQHLYESCLHVERVLKSAGAEDVGLYIRPGEWEYHFWVLAKSRTTRSGIRFHHVGITDRSRLLAKEDLYPPYVICTRDPESWSGNSGYTLVWRDQNLSLLRRIASDIPPGGEGADNPRSKDAESHVLSSSDA